MERVAELKIFARVTFFRTEDGGHNGPTPPTFFGCPFVMDDQMNDCRLLLDGIGSISPGQTVEVPIIFLCPKLVVDRLKVGREFKLWEMGIIAEGDILEVSLPQKQGSECTFPSSAPLDSRATPIFSACRSLPVQRVLLAALRSLSESVPIPARVGVASGDVCEREKGVRALFYFAEL